MHPFFAPEYQVGSYFTVQVLVNILRLIVSVTCLGPEHDDLSHGLWLLNMFLTAGISIVGTNLLCHRYLLQKAKAMVKMLVSTLRITSLILATPIPLLNVSRKTIN